MASNGCTCGCAGGNGCKQGSCSSPAVACYQKLRWQLDELGYQLVLPMEAVPLVGRLVADLLHTTSNLGRYKEATQTAERQLSEERKKSCSRRVERAFDDTATREEEIRELSIRVHRLEADIVDARFLAEQRQARVRALERESAEKSRLLGRLQAAPATIKEAGRRSSLKVSPAALPPGLPAGTRLWSEAFGAPTTRTKDPVVVTDEFAVKRMATRMAEDGRSIALLQEQVRQRDHEICRLTSMIAPSADDAQHSIGNLRAAIATLEEANKDLRCQLQDALRKQHEAMMRAVRLAERNQKLEADLKDVDGVAMSVEESCNTALRETSRHVTKLQDQLSICQQRISELEREATESRCNSQNLLLDIERLRLENDQLKEGLRLGKRQRSKLPEEEAAQFRKIENDLTAEIEKLVAKTTFQKRRIVELEERLSQSKAAGANPCGDHCADLSAHAASSTKCPHYHVGNDDPCGCNHNSAGRGVACRKHPPEQQQTDEHSMHHWTRPPPDRITTQEKQSVTTTSTTCKKTIRSSVKDSSSTSRYKHASGDVETRNTPAQTEKADTDYKIIQVDLTKEKDDDLVSSRSRNPPSTYASKSLNGRNSSEKRSESLSVRHSGPRQSENGHEVRQTSDTLKTTSSRSLQETGSRISISSKRNGQGDHLKPTNNGAKSHRKTNERSTDVPVDKSALNGNINNREAGKVGTLRGYGNSYSAYGKTYCVYRSAR